MVSPEFVERVFDNWINGNGADAYQALCQLPTPEAVLATAEFVGKLALYDHQEPLRFRRFAAHHAADLANPLTLAIARVKKPRKRKALDPDAEPIVAAGNPATAAARRKFQELAAEEGDNPEET